MDDTDRRICALAAEGFSDRRIAREVELSRMAVRKRRAKQRTCQHRAPQAPVYDGDDDPWDGPEGQLALDAEDDDDPYVEPFAFVGRERVWCERGKGEGGYWADEERFVDGNGRSLGRLDFWRWCTYRANDHDDRAGADRVAADMAAQIEAYERRA
jgi:hypothetical protein